MKPRGRICTEQVTGFYRGLMTKCVSKMMIVPSNSLWAEMVRECRTMHPRRFPPPSRGYSCTHSKLQESQSLPPVLLGAEKKKEEKYKRIHFHRRDSATCRNSGYRCCSGVRAHTHTRVCITTAVFLCSPKARSRFCSLVTGCHFVWTLNEDPESGSSSDVEMSASGSRREALARWAVLASQPKAPA